jgi:division protein CdvB (Snf7/Vps24/ESCRT-III family)
MSDPTDLRLDRIASTLEQIQLQMKGIETRLDTLEDQLDMASVADIDGALDDVRAEVRSIKDEML